MELDAQTIKELISSSPGGMPIVKDNAGVVKEVMDNEAAWINFEHDLRGEFWVEERDEMGIVKGYWKPYIDENGNQLKIMNERGTKENLIFFRRLADKSISISNFSDTEIKDEMKAALMAYRKFLIQSMDLFELNKRHLDFVVSVFEANLLSSWLSAKGGGLRSIVLGSVVERRITGSLDRKPGIFGGMGIFGGK